MEFGNTLRFFRRKLGYRQKEMLPDYHNSCTYSRIETGKQELKIADLKKILNNLSITEEEFFQFARADSLEENQEAIRELFRYCGKHLHNIEKKQELLNYYKKLHTKKNKSLQEWSNFVGIKNFFAQHWSEVESLTEAEVTQVFLYLKGRRFYLQYDYILFFNTVTYFSIKQADVLIYQLFPIEHLAQRDEITKKFAYNSLVTLINRRILQNQLPFAKKYIQLAQSLDGTYHNYAYRMNLRYLIHLISYLETGEHEHMSKIYTYLHLLEDIGEHIQAQQIKRDLKALTYQPRTQLTPTENYPLGLLRLE